MAVSVRMDPLLERQLEMAAQRRGVSKSQFIIGAVERELGLRDPGKLLLEVRQEFAPLRAAEAARGGPEDTESPHAAKLRALLRAKHEAALASWQPPVLPERPAARSAPPARRRAPRKPAREAAAKRTPRKR